MAGLDETQARQLLGDRLERLGRGPHDALGISYSATQADVRSAFLKLTKQFHPARFARMSSELQKLANEVFLGLRGAHDQLARPPKPPTRPPGTVTPPGGARAFPERPGTP